MADPVRERFVVDLAFDESVELSDRQRMAIAARISSLAHTIAAAEVAPNTVKLMHPDYKVQYAHRHESTPGRSCRYCVANADDEMNSSNIA